ncbi:hypothetical protein TNCV_4750841 [Trichonephila clavipes]|nr:hypothetical protein TNCV_4750841 [Trichonephila clavipes]
MRVRRRTANSLVSLVEGEEGGRPFTSPKVFSLEIGVDESQIILSHVWCSKLRLTTDRWIPRGVSFQRPRHRLMAVASLGRLPRNRSIPVWFTRYPRTALSDRWRSLGITSLMNIGGIRYVHIHSYIGHHDQACVLACKIQCISKFHEIKLKS